MPNGGIRKIIKSESQPVIIAAGLSGNQQIYFPDNQYIRDKKLMGLIVTTNLNEVLSAATPQVYVDGTQIIGFAEASQIYLTLESYAGVQFIRKKPINQFNAFLQQGIGLQFFAEFIGQKVNWPKCFIETSTAFAAAAVKRAVLFDIEFTELSKETIREQLAPTFGEKS